MMTLHKFGTIVFMLLQQEIVQSVSLEGGDPAKVPIKLLNISQYFPTYDRWSDYDRFGDHMKKLVEKILPKWHVKMEQNFEKMNGNSTVATFLGMYGLLATIHSKEKAVTIFQEMDYNKDCLVSKSGKNNYLFKILKDLLW